MSLPAKNPKNPGRPPLGELSLPFDAYDDIETYLCPNGHEVTRELYWIKRNSKGSLYKQCKLCSRDNNKRKYAKKKDLKWQL